MKNEIDFERIKLNWEFDFEIMLMMNE